MGLFTQAHAQETPRVRPQIQLNVPPTRAVLQAPAVISRSATFTPPILANTPAEAVILRAETPEATLQRLQVRRLIPMATMRAQSSLSISGATLNLRPMLENRLAPFNIAQSLRQLPNLAVVSRDETTGFEIDGGLIVRSTLTYRLKPGVCTNASARENVRRTGVSCVTRTDDAALVAALSNRADPRFVEDPAKRGDVLQQARANRATVAAEIVQDIANARGALNNSGTRAEISAEVGEAETARLATLNDEELTAEIINSAETEIEQIIFVPSAETPNARLSRTPMVASNVLAADQNAPAMLQIPAGMIGWRVQSASAPSQTASETTRSIDTRIFLTGFTLGRSYEWRQRVATTIKWCVVGCKKTYYGEVFARAGLGFGLRFPIQMSGLYKHRSVNGQETATLTANFSPIDGQEQDYRTAGLSSDQVFQGKEIVMEAIATAGVSFKLPYIGERSIAHKEGDDYTATLPPPFTNGQFRPPAPGEGGFPELTRTFEDADLIIGLANWGAFGAKVFPAIKAQLTSDKMRFRMRDLVAGGEPVWINNTGDTVTLAVNPSDHSSRFTLGNPEYNLSFDVTPGLVGQIFIDLSVWSHAWNWPVWFPQYSVQLPPGGQTFGCHDGTPCSHLYTYSPQSQSTTSGTISATDETLIVWKAGFENKYNPQCLDNQCRFGIGAISLATGIYLKKLINDGPTPQSVNLGIVTSQQITPQSIQEHMHKINQAYFDADNQAAEVIELAKVRRSQSGRVTTNPSVLPRLRIRQPRG